MPFYSEKYYILICDDCGFKQTIKNAPRVSYCRREGWSLSKDYKKVYCPSCGFKHISVGCRGYEKI